MTMQKLKRAALVAAAMTLGWVPAQAHHSFAMYDSGAPKLMTGVVVRTTPDPWHFQLFFAELNEERKAVVRNDAGEPIIWQIEMETAAIMASEGVTTQSMPPGSIVSIGFFPLRNGESGGARGAFAFFSCPANTPPAAGAHCDSVEGAVQHGEGVFPEL